MVFVNSLHCTLSFNIQTLWQMHDAHTAARDQIPYGIFSEGVVRQPAENGDPAQHRALQSGHRTPATVIPAQTHTIHITEHTT